jgi:hypothetical protein
MRHVHTWSDVSVLSLKLVLLHFECYGTARCRQRLFFVFENMTFAYMVHAQGCPSKSKKFSTQTGRGQPMVLLCR